MRRCRTNDASSASSGCSSSASPCSSNGPCSSISRSPDSLTLPATMPENARRSSAASWCGGASRCSLSACHGRVRRFERLLQIVRDAQQPVEVVGVLRAAAVLAHGVHATQHLARHLGRIAHDDAIALAHALAERADQERVDLVPVLLAAAGPGEHDRETAAARSAGRAGCRRDTGSPRRCRHRQETRRCRGRCGRTPRGASRCPAGWRAG